MKPKLDKYVYYKKKYYYKTRCRKIKYLEEKDKGRFKKKPANVFHKIVSVKIIESGLNFFLFSYSYFYFSIFRT